MCGPQIWLCLFTYRAIPLKQLNSVTTIDNFRSLGGPELKHMTGVREIPGSTPGSCEDFYALFLSCCCGFTFLSKTHSLSQNFAIPFAMFILLVFLTHCELFLLIISASRYRPSIFNTISLKTVFN